MLNVWVITGIAAGAMLVAELVHRFRIARVRYLAFGPSGRPASVSYTHLRAHETKANLVCRLLLEKKKY